MIFRYSVFSRTLSKRTLHTARTDTRTWWQASSRTPCIWWPSAPVDCVSQATCNSEASLRCIKSPELHCTYSSLWLCIGVRMMRRQFCSSASASYSSWLCCPAKIYTRFQPILDESCKNDEPAEIVGFRHACCTLDY